MTTLVTASTRPALARELLSLTKPRITLMNLVATAAAFGLAPGGASLATLVATLAGTGLVVGAANGLNCYLERDYDKLMARTRNRPLPAGRLDPATALFFSGATAVAGTALLVLAVNPLTGLLAAGALVGYVWIYTPLKRRTPWAILVGAVPGAAPPLVGWAAATGRIELPGLLLFLLLFFWQVPHFLAITLYRVEDYARAGFEVVPIRHGPRATRRHLFAFAAAMVATSLLLGPLGGATELYLLVAGALGAGLVVHAAQGLGRRASNRWARSFFMATNGYLTLLLGALVVDRFVR